MDITMVSQRVELGADPVSPCPVSSQRRRIVGRRKTRLDPAAQIVLRVAWKLFHLGAKSELEQFSQQL